MKKPKKKRRPLWLLQHLHKKLTNHLKRRKGL
jgi:hypothetical protein